MAIPNFCAIITAAGNSSRFNNGKEAGVKKEYLKINDHTVLYNAVAPFLTIPSLKAIIITTPKNSKKESLVALEEIGERCPVPLIFSEGGDSRQESVKKALSMLKNLDLGVEYVAIHDGARCFITPDLIIQTLATATVYGGCAPAVPLTSSVKEIDQNGSISKHLERSKVFAIQTPQVFHFPEIYLAHQNADENKSYTDDTEIYSDFDLGVGVCVGDPKNKKITYLNDIPDAEKQIEDYIKARDEGEKNFLKDKEFKSYLKK